MIKIHERKEEEKNNKPSFNGMVKFYGNVLGKLKEKRDEKIEKQRQQQNETQQQEID